MNIDNGWLLSAIALVGAFLGWYQRQIDKKLDKMDAKIDKLQECITMLDKQLTRIEGRFEERDFQQSQKIKVV